MYVVIVASEGGGVQEGDPGCVRHPAAAEVQHHREGEAQGALLSAHQDSVLSGLQVRPSSLPPSILLVTFSRIVPEVRYELQCQNIVQHICEEHYRVPVPVSPAPIFSTTPGPPRSPRSHSSPRPSEPPSKVKFPPALSTPATPSQRPSKRPSIRFKREPRPPVGPSPSPHHHKPLLGLKSAVKYRPGARHVSHQELPSPPGCRSILSQKCEKVPVKINRKVPEESCEEIPDIVCHLELETYEEPVCHNVEDRRELAHLSRHYFAGRRRGVRGRL